MNTSPVTREYMPRFKNNGAGATNSMRCLEFVFGGDRRISEGLLPPLSAGLNP